MSKLRKPSKTRLPGADGTDSPERVDVEGPATQPPAAKDNAKPRTVNNSAKARGAKDSAKSREAKPNSKRAGAKDDGKPAPAKDNGKPGGTKDNGKTASGKDTGKPAKYAKPVKELTPLCMAVVGLCGVLAGLFKVFGRGVPGLRADVLLVGLAVAQLVALTVFVRFSQLRWRPRVWWVLLPAAAPLLLLVGVFRAPAESPTWWSNALTVLAFILVVVWAAAKVFGGAESVRVPHWICRSVLVVAVAGVLVSGIAAGFLLSKEKGRAAGTRRPAGTSGVLGTTHVTTTNPGPPRARPSVTVSKAWGHTIPACTSPECAYVGVSFANFPSGKHKVTCYSDYPPPGGAFETYWTSLPTSYNCVYGYPGGHVWVYVDKIPSGRYTW
jgi:hypothetical protein